MKTIAAALGLCSWLNWSDEKKEGGRQRGKGGGFRGGGGGNAESSIRKVDIRAKIRTEEGSRKIKTVTVFSYDV